MSGVKGINLTTLLTDDEMGLVHQRRLDNISTIRQYLNEEEARIQGYLGEKPVMGGQTISLFGETVGAIDHQPEKLEMETTISTQKRGPAQKPTPINGKGRVKEGTTVEKVLNFIAQKGRACYQEVQDWAIKTGISDDSQKGKGRIYSTLFLLKGRGRLKAEPGPNPKGGAGKKVLYYSVTTTPSHSEKAGRNGNGRKARAAKPTSSRRKEEDDDELTTGGTSPPTTPPTTKLREVSSHDQLYELVRQVLHEKRDEPKSSVTFEELKSHVKQVAASRGFDLSHVAGSFFENGVRKAVERLQKEGLLTKGERLKWKLPSSQKPLPPPRRPYTEDDLETVVLALIGERPDELSPEDIVPTLIESGTTEWRHDSRISERHLSTMVEGVIERLLRSGDIVDDGGILAVTREKIAC